MEFQFSVNDVLTDEITRLDHNFNHRRRYLKFAHSSLDSQSRLATIVNVMGQRSAEAQGLRIAITSADRLQSTDHRLFVLKDAGACNGKGAVVGMVKVGRKKLFLSDHSSVLHEVTPLCVLDFYVHESRQRSGQGKRLFEHMLSVEGVSPWQVAIDRPSHKFLSFLSKHYQLKSFVKQANNYVVFDKFFHSNPDVVQQGNQRGNRSHNYQQQHKHKTANPNPSSASSVLCSTQYHGITSCHSGEGLPSVSPERKWTIGIVPGLSSQPAATWSGLPGATNNRYGNRTESYRIWSFSRYS